jgi:uncharacterized repeat protein (TIGR01451 family)
MNKKWWWAIGGGAALIIVIAAFWFWQEQQLPPQVMTLNITGPQNATAGVPIAYTVNYKNTGKFVLQDLELTFMAPDNSVTDSGNTLSTQKLPDLDPGQSSSTTITVKLLGKQGDIQMAKAALSYTPKNLTAQYESDASFNTTISSVPITLNFDMPVSSAPGGTAQFAVDYFSNFSYALQNVSVKILPVQGFTVTSATPTSLDNQEWKIGNLNQNQGGRITVNGTVDGSVGEPLQFTAQLGIWNNGNFVVVQQEQATVQVSQTTASGTGTPAAPLSVSQKVYYQNDDIPNTGPTPPEVGQITTYTVVWMISNSGKDLSNVQIKATLPAGVQFTNQILPSDQLPEFSYDPDTGQISWSAGDIAAGSGISGDPDVLEFQLSFIPTSAQRGSVAELIGAAQISGTDANGNTVTAQSPSVSTALPNDAPNSGGGVVQ